MDLGRQLEELERPNAEASRAEGGRAGAAKRWGDGSTSKDVDPSGPTRNPTDKAVSDALGIGTASYQHVGLSIGSTTSAACNSSAASSRARVGGGGVLCQSTHNGGQKFIPVRGHSNWTTLT